jgi:hypothetical protein
LYRNFKAFEEEPREREITRDLRNDFDDEDALRLPELNFKFGLGHVLSGILAHLSSTVLSATMAWHLVIKDSRFQLSHDFSHIHLSQFESWLLGEDIQFRYRRNKQKETGWIDSNVFQYIYRPDEIFFENVCVWEYFQNYEMRLISSLSRDQKENMENDFEENLFFRFSDKYPGYEFACLEKLNSCKIPMLFYRDHIPDLEQCNINGEDDDVDDATLNIRYVYATKMLLLFYPFHEHHEFPLFQYRWNFFCEAHENGSLYWDSRSIMQNFQDIENSKKIVSKQDSSEVLIDVNSEGDFEQDTNFEIDENGECNQGITSKEFENQVRDDGLDVIFEEFGLHADIDGWTNFQLEENVCRNLTKKMKEHHVSHDPVSSEESASIQKLSIVSGQSSTIEDYDHQHNIKSDSSDVVKVVLNIDQSIEKNEPQ